MGYLCDLPNDVIKHIIHKLSNDIVTIQQFACSSKMIKTFIDEEMKEEVKHWFVNNLKECFLEKENYLFDIQFINYKGNIETIYVKFGAELNYDELKKNVIRKRNIWNNTNVPSDDDISITSRDYSYDTKDSSTETIIRVNYKGNYEYFGEFENEYKGFDDAASYIFSIINRTIPIINITNHEGAIDFENIVLLTIIPPVKTPLQIKIYNRFKDNLIKMKRYDRNSKKYFVLQLQNSYIEYRIEKWLKYCDDEKEDYFKNYSDNKMYEDMIITDLTYHLLNLFEIFISKRELHYRFDKLLSIYTNIENLRIHKLLKDYSNDGKLSPMLVKVLLPFPDLYNSFKDQIHFLSESQIEHLKRAVCLRRRVAFAATLS